MLEAARCLFFIIIDLVASSEGYDLTSMSLYSFITVSQLLFFVHFECKGRLALFSRGRCFLKEAHVRFPFVLCEVLRQTMFDENSLGCLMKPSHVFNENLVFYILHFLCCTSQCVDAAYVKCEQEIASLMLRTKLHRGHSPVT